MFAVQAAAIPIESNLLPAQQLLQAVLLPPSPSFSFLALAGEIRPQPSLIPACQSVCPCLA